MVKKKINMLELKEKAVNEKKKKASIANMCDDSTM